MRRQVGALIVKNKMIISDGYNGTPSGFRTSARTKPAAPSPTCCTPRPTRSQSRQVEQQQRGATLYVTSSPCIECAKLIIQSGIRRVVFCDDYHSSDGIELLRRVGIEVEKVTLPPVR
ncbi:MAG: deoxycytidylate deaminase [Alistipes sp.]